MKQFLLGCLLFLALSRAALAMPPVTITMALPHADTAYLVRVTYLDKGKVTFSVTETLRGDAIKVLSLVPGEIDLKQNDELLICSSKASRNGWRGNVVGGVMLGVVGWNYATVMRDGNEVYVSAEELKDGHWVSDKHANGGAYFTLEHIKRFMKENPQKP